MGALLRQVKGVLERPPEEQRRERRGGVRDRRSPGRQPRSCSLLCAGPAPTRAGRGCHPRRLPRPLPRQCGLRAACACLHLAAVLLFSLCALLMLPCRPHPCRIGRRLARPPPRSAPRRASSCPTLPAPSRGWGCPPHARLVPLPGPFPRVQRMCPPGAPRRRTGVSEPCVILLPAPPGVVRLGTEL